ncbi:MAG TPA: SDR family NAD(P)-dependent oxidoreductase [Nocardioidaceae bacterium]|nr:SDR family NAD(P)-dependent oxidoreductase [Nocardioidaceae bacterium]
MTNLSGARVLLTGASSGLGRACALAMAARGARLTLTGRDEERLAETAEAVGGDLLVADLASAASTQALVEALGERPVPDVVVHNAGAGLVGAAEDVDLGDWERLLAVNVCAPLGLTAALLPGMRARGSGHLVFVTSVAAHLGVPEEAAYSATKAALAGYAAGLRAELAGTDLVVTTFAPGVVDTDFFTRRGAPYERRVPRLMPPGRVAARLVRAVEADRDEVVVPSWMRLPIALRAVAPGAYWSLSRRWA